MKNILAYLDKAIYFSLIYITITFPLSFRYSNVGLVALVVFWIVKKGIAKEGFHLSFRNRNERLVFFSYLLLFFWQVITLFYTENLESGVKNLEGKLSLLVLPIVMYDLKLDIEKWYSLVKFYIYSLSVCTLFLLGQSTYNYFSEGYFLTYHDFTRSLDFHAVFYSYYIFLSLQFVFMLYRKMNLKKFEKWIMVASVVFSVVALIISASKNVIVVSILSFVVALSLRVFKQKLKAKEVLISILVVILSGLAISQIPSIKNRYLELGKLDGIENLDKINSGILLTHEDNVKFNGTSLRIVFWSVGIKKLLSENRLMIGLTPGDRRAIMNEEFYENGLNPAFENYNLHNQYVQTFVEMGLIGLLLYVLLNFFYFKLAISDKNYLLLIFMIAFTIFQMTESVLERNKGIVFFIFFILFFQKLTPQINENRNIRN